MAEHYDLEQLTKAAEQGDRESQFNLGVMFRNGESSDESYKQQRLWFGKAGRQGHMMAQYFMGSLHQRGQGGPVSMEKARIWYERAAKQGDKPSQKILASMIARGLGDPAGTATGDSCAYCRKVVPRMMGCPCGLAQYCSKECQRGHWPVHKKVHKKTHA